MSKGLIWTTAVMLFAAWAGFHVLAAATAFEVSFAETLSAGVPGVFDLPVIYFLIWALLTAGGTWLVAHFRDELPSFGKGARTGWLCLNLAYGMFTVIGILGFLPGTMWMSTVGDLASVEGGEGLTWSVVPWLFVIASVVLIPLSEWARRNLRSRDASSRMISREGS